MAAQSSAAAPSPAAVPSPNTEWSRNVQFLKMSDHVSPRWGEFTYNPWIAGEWALKGAHLGVISTIGAGKARLRLLGEGAGGRSITAAVKELRRPGPPHELPWMLEWTATPLYRVDLVFSFAAIVVPRKGWAAFVSRRFGPLQPQGATVFSDLHEVLVETAAVPGTGQGFQGALSSAELVLDPDMDAPEQHFLVYATKTLSLEVPRMPAEHPAVYQRCLQAVMEHAPGLGQRLRQRMYRSTGFHSIWLSETKVFMTMPALMLELLKEAEGVATGGEPKKDPAEAEPENPAKKEEEEETVVVKD
eukprot:RCo026853